MLFRITGHSTDGEYFDKYTLAADFVEAAQKAVTIPGIETITVMAESEWI